MVIFTINIIVKYYIGSFYGILIFLLQDLQRTLSPPEHVREIFILLEKGDKYYCTFPTVFNKRYFICFL